MFKRTAAAARAVLLFLIVGLLMTGVVCQIPMTGSEFAIRIENSYCVWSPLTMKEMVQDAAVRKYHSDNVEGLLSRSYLSIYIEWWLHNIGYYVTKPICFIDVAGRINLRCKDVDLGS